MAEPSWVSTVALILRALGLGPVADELEKDLASGKLTPEGGVELVEAVTDAASRYFPNQKPELDLAHDVAAAVDKYLKAHAAAKTKPVTPPPPPAH